MQSAFFANTVLHIRLITYGLVGIGVCLLVSVIVSSFYSLSSHSSGGSLLYYVPFVTGAAACAGFVLLAYGIHLRNRYAYWFATVLMGVLSLGSLFAGWEFVDSPYYDVSFYIEMYPGMAAIVAIYFVLLVPATLLMFIPDVRESMVDRTAARRALAVCGGAIIVLSALVYTATLCLCAPPPDGYLPPTEFDAQTKNLSAVYENVYLYKTESSPANSEIIRTTDYGRSFVRVIGGVDQQVTEKINARLADNTSCLPLSTGPNSAKMLQDRYLDEIRRGQEFGFKITPIVVTENEVRGWDAEYVWSRLMSDFEYEAYASSTVTFNDNGILSLSTSYIEFCGYVHPYVGSIGYTFDLSTGNEITFPELFVDYEKDKETILQAVYAYAEKDLAGDALWVEYCSDAKLDLNGELRSVESYNLTPAGIDIQSTGLPYGMKNCEISDVVPYPVLKPFLLPLIRQAVGASLEVSAEKLDIKASTSALFVLSDELKEVVGSRSREVLLAIKSGDFEKLSTYVHPQKGVRFSPYTYVCVEGNDLCDEPDLVFDASRIRAATTDETVYRWGYYDGSGFPIEHTFKNYFKKFVYSYDFATVAQVSYNDPIFLHAVTYNNVLESYPDSIVVEYHYPGSELNEGMDLRSLRLVFEMEKDLWYLVGIVHDIARDFSFLQDV